MISRSLAKVSVYSKLYVPIFQTVCNNISMKFVIKRAKSGNLKSH